MDRRSDKKQTPGKTLQEAQEVVEEVVVVVGKKQKK